jgi:glycosyltransferase involved in cell wall biosynthesis
MVCDDAASFAQAVSKLLTDESEARRMGRAARAFVEAHWTWDSLFTRLEASLLEAAAR